MRKFIISIAILFILCGFKIHDGDTFTTDDGIVVRLWGIDAPEEANPHTRCPEQTCLRADGSIHHCGHEATEYLTQLIKMHPGTISCIEAGSSYGRKVGNCFIGSLSIGHEMIKAGWAVEETYYSAGEFTWDEDYAKEHHLGIWQGDFQRPYLYRKTCKKRLASHH